MGVPAAPVDALVNSTAVLRGLYVRELRDRSLRVARHIRDELERSVARHPLEALHGVHDSPHTRFCWLNQTLRTWADQQALAEVAEDPAVEAIDVPRPLRLEVSVSAHTVGATHYRVQTGRSGKGVVVAVIDTEIRANHRAFEGRVHNMCNFSNQDWGHPRSHGTAVAGIIAARHAATCGIAPDATIYSYKLITSRPTEDFFGALALQQALADGAHIANCSWGTSAPTDGTSREARACDNAWACGMTVVKSAGNDGPHACSVTSPADAAGVIVVGSVNREGTRITDGSSRGPTLHGKVCPDLVAPGGERSDRIQTCRSDGGFGGSSEGTSLAAAHVSGLLCLLLEEKPCQTPDEQRDALWAMCEKLPDSGENDQGHGLVSLARLR